MNHDSLTWKAPSHIPPRRSFGWYVLFFIIASALIAYAIFTQSIISALTFFLLTVVTLIFAIQPSRLITNSITKTGINVGRTHYPYKAVKRFWIIYIREVKTLNFETTAYLNNRVIVQLGKQDPLPLKSILSKYLPEDLEMEEPFSETLARKLKI